MRFFVFEYWTWDRRFEESDVELRIGGLKIRKLKECTDGYIETRKVKDSKTLLSTCPSLHFFNFRILKAPSHQAINSKFLDPRARRDPEIDLLSRDAAPAIPRIELSGPQESPNTLLPLPRSRRNDNVKHALKQTNEAHKPGDLITQ